MISIYGQPDPNRHDTELPSIHDEQEPELVAVPTSAFSMDALAEIYNQTRVDYIVPMPMNAKRLQDYVDAYDIDLDASLVVQTSTGDILGISMLGVRENRAWITRLGVLPFRRRRGTGQFIMDHHLKMARRSGAGEVQLEVIKGNEPAHKLFCKNGFLETRELLVIRRPPTPLEAAPVPNGRVSEMLAPEIRALLDVRCDDPAWTEESATFANLTGVKGLRLETSSGETGHLIYQLAPFQLSHIVLSPSARQNLDVAYGLLLHLHQSNPVVDTKVENVPVDDPLWPLYRDLGYVEVFRRIEMRLLFGSSIDDEKYH